jgi:hypothetical protein
MLNTKAATKLLINLNLSNICLGSETWDPEKCYSASLVKKTPDTGSRTAILIEVII